MRILLINYEYPPVGAGASNATFNIAKSLLKLGNEVFVLTSCFKDLKGWKNENGINVYRTTSFRKKAGQSNTLEMSSFAFSASLTISKIIKSHCIDKAIVFFTIPCGPIAYLAKKRFNIDYIVSLRGGDVPGYDKKLDFQHKVLKPLRRMILKNGTHIVANSVGLKNLSETYDPFPVLVIPNGVDVDFFKPLPRITNKFKNLLFVGRLHYEKNVKFLLEQINIFRNSGKNIILDIVGEGPEKKSLVEYVQTNNLYEFIKFHSWKSKDELKQFYNKADCVINPSFNEGMSNVVLEAMSSGLPVIASNVVGNNELVKNGETGFLFDIGDNVAFQEALNKLNNNPELCSEFGNNARKWVVDDFSWDKVAFKYQELMNKTE